MRTFILLSLILALASCTAESTMHTTETTHMEASGSMGMAGMDHMGHGADSGTAVHNSAEPIPGAAEIRVVATEFGYEPATLTLTMGEPINIVLVNQGQLPHELGIPELEFHAHAEAGETTTVGFTPTTSGDFEFACRIAGHYEAGMLGELTIQ